MWWGGGNGDTRRKWRQRKEERDREIKKKNDNYDSYHKQEKENTATYPVPFGIGLLTTQQAIAYWVIQSIQIHTGPNWMKSYGPCLVWPSV